MKKHVRIMALTGALALMIPLSAYAATSGTAAKTEKANAPIAQQGGRGGDHGREAVSQTVLDLLKLDAAAFKAKAEEGKTLAQIAEEQGVSRDSLKQALTDDFTKKQAEEKTRFANNLDNQLDGKLNAGKGGAFGLKNTVTSAEAATILGLTEAQLKTELSAGKSLADIAKEKGVDSQKLIDVQKAAIVKSINEALAAGKLTQEQADKRLAEAAADAENIVNGKGFKGNGGGKGHRGGR
ncbi:hypothetical protein ACFPVX_14570 [Cohnella faecalis]|uniref:LysM domain-containing protein n=1 Tax=Cohnella faecalis TaxID=2315694 RepID=A0A398CGD7_9BACL|nr:hypothetical protein [Cohnella faecalis]RIE02286.1 hypothetical protein D3H35_16310 [Cohnella faecalis]